MKCKDCIFFRESDGYCRNGLVKSTYVGALQPACEKFSNETPTPIMTETTKTAAPGNRICKTCGEEKPLSEFYYIKSSNCYEGTCKACRNKKASEYQKTKTQEKKAAKAQAEVSEEKPAKVQPSEKTPEATITRILHSLPDAALSGELARRGWIGTLTRKESLTINCE